MGKNSSNKQQGIGLHSTLYVFAALTFLVILGMSLRLFWLDRAPSGALVDEMHFGYIAYSLLLTGKDEHGVDWPLVFKGFGDQKLPVYAYTLIPFVQTFGLSVTTIRLPSALAGVLSILAIYFFARELTRSRKFGLISAAIMTTSPWPFFLSRFGFESNVGVLFWLVSLNGLIRMQKNRWWGIIGAVFAGLTWYTYIAYRPVTLVLLLVYFGVLWFKQKPLRKTVALATLVFIGVILPFLSLSPSTANNARLKQVGIFTDQGNLLVINENRTFCSESLPTFVCSVLYNKGTVYMQTIASRLLHTFSPQYLATSGESAEQYLTVERFGQFYFLLYPFFILGLFMLLRNSPRMRPHLRWLALTGLLIAPIPNILAGEPHKVRLSPFLPFAIVTMTVGIGYIWNWIVSLRGRMRPAMVGLVVVFIAGYLGLNAIYFTTFFTVHVNKNDFQYQTHVRSLIPYIHEQIVAGKQVYLKPNFSDPMMYYAFYTKMDPNEYRRQVVLGGLESSGFQHAIALDHFFVTDHSLQGISCNEQIVSTRPTLFVTNSTEEGARPIHEVKSVNGSLTYNYIYDATAFSQLPGNCE